MNYWSEAVHHLPPSELFTVCGKFDLRPTNTLQHSEPSVHSFSMFWGGTKKGVACEVVPEGGTTVVGKR